MSRASHRSNPDRPPGRIVIQKVGDAERTMGSPLWEWINDWYLEGALSTMDAFTGRTADGGTETILLFGCLVEGSPNDLVDRFILHLTAFCRDHAISEPDAAFHPAEPTSAPSSNTGHTDSDAPTSAREMWGFPPNLGHIPPGAGDN